MNKMEHASDSRRSLFAIQREILAAKALGLRKAKDGIRKGRRDLSAERIRSTYEIAAQAIEAKLELVDAVHARIGKVTGGPFFEGGRY